MCRFEGGRAMRVFNKAVAFFNFALRLPVIVLAVSFFGSSSSRATDYTWTGAGAADNWNDPTNWSPAGTPALTSIVTFPTIGSSYSVQWSTAQFPSHHASSLV